MPTSAGIVCHGNGFGCTVIDDSGDVVDHDLAAPSNLPTRGDKLSWLADEAQRLVEANGVELIGLQRPGGGKFGASGDRYEVEAAVQIGASRAGAGCQRLNREQVRAALGVPKAQGAYERLLQRDDVSVRSNASRRDQYLLALAARG